MENRRIVKEDRIHGPRQRSLINELLPEIKNLILRAVDIFPVHQVYRAKMITISMNSLRRRPARLAFGCGGNPNHMGTDLERDTGMNLGYRQSLVSLNHELFEEIVTKIFGLHGGETAMNVPVELIKFFRLKKNIVLKDLECA